jgi:hypothetical protein
VVPILQADGSYFWEIARGGVFSYYEFVWPGADRLTDEAWRSMLDAGTAPAVPAWTASFRAPTGEYNALRNGVFYGTKTIIEAVWCPPCYVDNLDYYPLLQSMAPELIALRDNRQYMGHQLLSQHFLSFDMISSTQAVVTVREVWEDTLYSGEWPDEYGPVVGTRPQYEVIATYAMQLSDNNYDWEATGVSYNIPLPEWVSP